MTCRKCYTALILALTLTFAHGLVFTFAFK